MRTSGHIANVKAWVYHVYSVCTLLKVFGNYDLSVLSRSVMGFQKKFGWLGGWGELYPILSGFLEIFKLQSPCVFTTYVQHGEEISSNRISCCICY